MTSSFVLASAQYPLDQLRDWDDYTKKIEHWVTQAANAGARVLLFPEYFSLELISLLPATRKASLAEQFDALQELLPQFIALFSELSMQRNLVIVAGTFPVRHAAGEYRNRAYLFHPRGDHEWQDKIQMTRFEREAGLVSSGDQVRTFDTAFGRIGIAICYDAEFPMIARPQVEAGATLILVPSCTDTLAGYWRVRVGCQARALENQCYVAQAATVGDATWLEAADINIGAAGIYSPIDYGFPDNGVLGVGELSTPQWIYATLDMAAIAHVRAHGQVRNHLDWSGQFF